MMDYTVYILYSKTLKKHYIGATTNFETRMDLHAHPAKKKFTKNAEDWELHFKIRCDSMKQALEIEKHIKSMKSKIYIQNLIKYPEMLEKLKSRFKT